METAHDTKKRAVILLWCIATSLFLWYFAFLLKPEFNIIQYANFCILIYGGGLAYHIVTELALCPYDKSNSDIWSQILRKLLIVFIGYIIAGGSLGIGKYMNNGYGWIIALTGIIAGMFWSMHFLFKLKHPIRELISANKG